MVFWDRVNFKARFEAESTAIERYESMIFNIILSSLFLDVEGTDGSTLIAPVVCQGLSPRHPQAGYPDSCTSC